MTSFLSTNITKNYFDESLFNEMFTKSPNCIKNDPSLLFKSVHLDNLKSFEWAASKVNWEKNTTNLLKFLMYKNNLSEYFSILYKNKPEIILDLKNELLHIFLKNCIYTVGNIKQSQLKIIELLLKEGASVSDQEVLTRMLEDPGMHPLLFKVIETGSKPRHLNNFFSEYCKNGHPDGIRYFKDWGCDMRYLNDLPLKNASQRHNELMVRYLIEKENANPTVSNYFIFFTLLHEDDCSEASAISFEMINYLAQLLNECKNIPTDVMEKLLEHKYLKHSFNYLKINASVLPKKIGEDKKRTKL